MVILDLITNTCEGEVITSMKPMASDVCKFFVLLQNRGHHFVKYTKRQRDDVSPMLH